MNDYTGIPSGLSQECLAELRRQEALDLERRSELYARLLEKVEEGARIAALRDVLELERNSGIVYTGLIVTFTTEVNRAQANAEQLLNTPMPTH